MPKAQILTAGTGQPSPFARSSETRDSLGYWSRIPQEPKKRLWVIAIALGVLSVGGGLTYYRVLFRPSQESQKLTPQTAVARRGDIVLSAIGTGTLQPANEVRLGF